MEMFAAINRVDPAAVRECIAMGTDVNWPDPWDLEMPMEERESALEAALNLEPSGGKVEIISLLLEAGASVEWATAAMMKHPPLCLLAEHGDVECMKLLLRAGADVKLRGKKGSCLGNAVKSRSVPTVQLLLDAGMQFSTDRRVARCLLHLALESPEMLQLLMNNGIHPADYPRVSEDDFGMLDTVISCGSAKKIAALVAMGFDPEDTTWNPTSRRVICGTDAELAEHLKSSPNLNQRHGYMDNTLCELAVKSSSLSKLKLLLYAGAERGERLLHLAAETRDLKCLEYLISLGLPLDVEIGLGTPLMIACQEINLGAVKMLLEAGATVDLQNSAKETALNQIVRWSPHPFAESLEILKLLHQYGADLNHVDNLRVCLVKGMAEHQHHEALRWLIAQGVELNRNGFEGTPLRQAVKNDDLIAMEILLQGGADPNVRLEDDETVLFDVKSAAAVKLLLKYGADPELRDNLFDRTALEAIRDPLILAAFACEE